MKKLISIFAMCLLLVSAMGSCGSSDPTPDPTTSPVTDPPTEYEQLVEAAKLPNTMLVTRAGELSAALKTDTYRSGVYLYGSSRVYLGTGYNALILAARLKLLGITDVYNYVEPAALTGSNASQNAWFKDFNAQAHKYGMRVWALSFMETGDYTNTGSYTGLGTRVNAVKAFNASVAADQKFDGYSLDYEPHILTASLSSWPSGLPKTADYTWVYTGGQGIPGPNNTLLGITIDMCKAVRTLAGPDALIHEAISYIFQRDFDAGKYDKGSAVQFLEPCNNLVVMAYEKTAAKIWTTSQGILNNAKTKEGTDKSVSLCIKTDVNSEGTDPIDPRTWVNLVAIVKELNSAQMGGTQRAYAGVDFFSYSGLQQIWFEL